MYNIAHMHAHNTDNTLCMQAHARAHTHTHCHTLIGYQGVYTLHKGNMEYLYTIHYRKYKVYTRAVLAREFLGIKYMGVPVTCDTGYVFYRVKLVLINTVLGMTKGTCTSKTLIVGK